MRIPQSTQLRLLMLTMLAVQGAVVSAQSCTSHNQCGAGSFCRGIDSPDSCPLSSECEPLPAEGDQCHVYSLACRSDTCASAALTCVPGISRCLEVGAICNTDGDCGAGNYCSKCFSTASGQGFCLRLPVAGEICNRNCAADTCAPGFVCGGDYLCHEEGTEFTTTAFTTTTTTTPQASSVPSYYCANRPCSYDASMQCQCDDACVDYGDCCPDREKECTDAGTTANPVTTAADTTTDPDGVPAYYCANRPCTYDASFPCQCDDACPGYGDCCPDHDAKCGDVPVSTTMPTTTTTTTTTDAGPDTTTTTTDNGSDTTTTTTTTTTTEGDTTTTADTGESTTTGAVPDYYCANRPCSYDASMQCQCDDACVDYGDCCPDREDACGGGGGVTTTTPDAPTTTTDAGVDTTTTTTTTTTTAAPDTTSTTDGGVPAYYCANRPCGYDASMQCQCDDACTGYGDCCPDYTEVCAGGGSTAPPFTTPDGTLPPGTACGYSQVPYGVTCVQYVWESSPTAALPTPPLSLAEISSVVIGHYMIVFGDGDLGTLDNRKTLAFNFQTSTWDAATARAERPYWGDHTAIEVYNGELYAFAGLCCQTFCTGCGATSKVQIYDPVDDAWRLGTPIPWNVDGAMSSSIIDGKIYVCGGLWQDWPSPNCGIYNPATDSWAPMPDMPKPMHHTGAGTDGSKFYIFGGRLGGNGLSQGQDDVQIYDPATNTWTWDKTSAIKSLPTGRTGMGKAAFLHGEFYLMGGEYFPDQDPKVLPTGVYNLVEIYNPTTNTWRQGPPMPTGLHGLHPVIYDNQIYIAGGGDHIGRGTSKAFQRYKPF
ncbi:hypothetical protein PTSG_06880 [Salpingoeca rosetta]|uniref:SMB domain-containing protein n=1 Tax=Salpingoeca rosetta (strain ATCC 50818 / BSB-021) TaxID=946362 RepID=F2UF26_SALR5|nr:uncharacterized protein PTSG_06880 [Salpingoeca rosetta]EGD75226.1 hypothetical protein PTSG_06880 [Salpingoeca rosetta]|eukprot:XP_004992279.1 hypothetical protein PTSG_06880 [Salpingoeca rosetta]